MVFSRINKFSSRVDYPQAGLPKDLWDKRDNSYLLKPEVESAVKNMVDSILMAKFNGSEKWVKDYLLGSSVATQFWKETSDLDIKVVIDPILFKTANQKYFRLSDQEIKEMLLEVFDEHKGKEYFVFGKRPLDMYPVLAQEVPTEAFQKHFDSLYDINKKAWIKEPMIYDVKDYDRDKVVEKGEELALMWAEKWDLDIGKMKRKIAEIEQLDNYLKTLDVDSAKAFKGKLEKLSKNVQQEIEQMVKEKNFIKEEYYKVYDEFTPDLERFYQSVNALPEVIRMKLLILWGYIFIIKNLSKIIKNKDLKSDNIDEVKYVLNKPIPEGK